MSEHRIASVARLARPALKLARPVLLGIDRLPETGPRLFVGNHTLGGIFDVPFFLLALHERTGVYPRALGDHAHFSIPVWRSVLGKLGVVDGTRENCAALFQQREDVLVFPGGAREVCKRRGERYQLVWGDRYGFARMAFDHQVPIVPFAAIGVEDALEIVVDPEEILSSPLGTLLTRLGVRRDLVFPLVKGVGPTPLPRDERLYFEIGEPLLPSEFSDPWELREATREAIERGIRTLHDWRAQDPDRQVFQRVMSDWLG